MALGAAGKEAVHIRADQKVEKKAGSGGRYAFQMPTLSDPFEAPPTKSQHLPKWRPQAGKEALKVQSWGQFKLKT